MDLFLESTWRPGLPEQAVSRLKRNVKAMPKIVRINATTREGDDGHFMAIDAAYRIAPPMTQWGRFAWAPTEVLERLGEAPLPRRWRLNRRLAKRFWATAIMVMNVKQYRLVFGEGD